MIILGIATIPERKDTLKSVLDPIVKQVDQVFLALNGFYIADEPWYPPFLDEYSNLNHFHTHNEKGDAHKFCTTGIIGEGHYYISWDDDLIMPDGCVKYLCDGVDKYNGLVGLHGRKYLSPVTSFRKWAGNYRCLGDVSEDVSVNLIGSGCAAFHTDRLTVTMNDFKKPFMADCYLSRLASEQGVPMRVLAHSKDYLGYTNPTETIWQNTTDFSEQTRILQSYIN
jgi:hypothetical protein